MFMKVIYSSIIPQKGYKAITILNMVFVRKGYTMRLADLNHEAIHWEQEKELPLSPSICYTLLSSLQDSSRAATGILPTATYLSSKRRTITNTMKTTSKHANTMHG